MNIHSGGAEIFIHISPESIIHIAGIIIHISPERLFTSPGIRTKHVRRLFRAGISKAAIARKLEIGRTSVRRILALKK